MLGFITIQLDGYILGFIAQSVTSGVPQGSQCAPILFLLFIDDLQFSFNHSMYLLYADDLKLFRRIDSRDDAVKRLSDLDNLQKWCRNNHLFLNISKTLKYTICSIENG